MAFPVQAIQCEHSFQMILLHPHIHFLELKILLHRHFLELKILLHRHVHFLELEIYLLSLPIRLLLVELCLPDMHTSWSREAANSSSATSWR